MTATLTRLTLVAAGTLALLATAPAPAQAQAAATSFDQLRLRLSPGETVYVTDSSGQRTKGRVVAVSASALTLSSGGRPLELAQANVTRVERRRRDSIKNGALAGAGAGAAIGLLAGSSADGGSGCRSECGQGKLIGTVGGAFWGAVVGGLADALRHRQEVLFEAIHH